jgi:hypothetical protein
VQDAWSPRSPQIRLEVEDGVVTLAVTGVLDAHTTTMIREDLLPLCRLAASVVLDLRAVDQLRPKARLGPLLDDTRSECWLTGCRFQVLGLD